MLRKLGYGLLFAGALFSASAFSTNLHEFNVGISLDYELPPNDPQEFVNSWFWTITSVCTIHSQDSSNPILIEVLKRSGKINGTELSEGDNIYVTVHDGDKVTIVADSGGKVRLTNKGPHTISASCSA
ncbi:hypothetical protein [Legionella jordanis]|uniref:Secreted protein n=1 Tax=Legionella jordanis TaxID=456 RepID=A0A0W0VFC9_9GAMM|nr:hypothetical protein [Legionella jordanis]KTD18869.1 hypothetical protein Ljor_0092 [Legionella jordanis]RMX05560.1 hypothetical protein EAW55_02620 [Legionella jordanis]RMX19245.1 hypothetical protein EAS68_07385 [Legionella jordanis]VEH12969.1 Uncharacterised protein [Legionella jordanis]HAT8714012.1 hypothetical protein [Legionella jordanis]